MCSCKNDLFAAAFRGLVRLGDDLGHRHAALAASDGRHDAVGADLIAAFLDLDGRTRSPEERQHRVKDILIGIAGGLDSETLGKSLDYLPLLPIGDDEVHAREGCDRLRIALRVASRGDHKRIGESAARGRNRPARFPVRHVRHRARVQQIDIRGIRFPCNGESGIDQVARDPLAIRCIQLAAVRLYDY